MTATGIGFISIRENRENSERGSVIILELVNDRKENSMIFRVAPVGPDERK
jgi:hypothetical protein